jgi:glycolate oxidase FAD binding subunit
VLGARLQGLVGLEHVSQRSSACGPYAVDGVLPDLVVRPGTQEEVAAVVAACHAAGASMVPWGGGTAMGLGNGPAKAEVVILLDRLNRVVAFDPANLVVTAEAGLRLGVLQGLLARDGECLPLDPPAPDRVTLGGLVAANQSGPGRLRYGTVRDWLLGLRVVLPDGEAIQCGGRVIKNVSGYDMNKLFIRSLGTLGIITEVTVKLLPMPEQRAGVVGLFPDLPLALAAVTQVLGSFLLPEALDLLDPAALRLLEPVLGLAPAPGAYAVAVALAGSPETVARQSAELMALFAAGGASASALPADPTLRAWEAIRNLFERVASTGPAPILCRITVPIARIGELLADARWLGESNGLNPVVLAHAGSGVLWVEYRPGPGSPAGEALAVALEGLRRQAVAVEGTLVLQSAPPELKRCMDAWGDPGPAFGVMCRIKQQFDPRGLCSPGRFVGRL